MLKLTNQVDSPVYINPSNIISLELCNLNDFDHYTEVSIEARDNMKGLGVKIHFTSGKSLIVKECINIIKAELNKKSSYL